jgi:hypothetical protein
MTKRRRNSVIHEGGENDDDSEEKVVEEIHEFRWYMGQEQMFKIVSEKWGTFCLFTSVIYTYHLLWCIAGVNVYADYTRKMPCGDESMTAEAATTVFDVAIAMCVVFHMIEWIRWTLLLTAALVEANLLPLFNALQINIPFGVIACLVAIVTRYGSEGSSCAVEGIQPTRGFYCGLQVICLILMIPFSFAHIVYMKLKGVEWCHEMWTKEEDDDD